MFRSIELPDEIDGELFLHSMLGRNEPLELALNEISRKNIVKVVSLASIDEIRQKSSDYAQAIDENSLPFERVEFAIADYGVPKERDEFMNLAKEIADGISSKKNVTVLISGLGTSSIGPHVSAVPSSSES